VCTPPMWWVRVARSGTSINQFGMSRYLTLSSNN